MKTRFVIIVMLTTLVLGCKPKPQAIVYGTDSCHYCKMTIVDKLHAAEIVTNKGKVFKFDAAECMIRFMDEFDTSEIELNLTNIYTEPEVLIDATKATFLISENVPSPMGAFLSAFRSKTDAERILTEKGGKLYTWESILDKFKQ